MRKIMRVTLLSVLLLALLATAFYFVFTSVYGPDRTLVYRTIDGTDLSLNVFDPVTKSSGNHPAILFYHGGAWTAGSPEQFYPYAKHFASLGWVAISAQYRINGRHGSNAFDSVEDGRAAYRYIQEHSAELGIDPHRVVLSGGSAGGHLAATIVMTPWPERGTAPPPIALALLNPALDTAYGEDATIAPLFLNKGEQISPAHHVTPNLPPTFIVHGSDDTLVPIAQNKAFCKHMRDAGNRCRLSEHLGVGHGFFNWGGGHYDEVLAEVVKFAREFE